MPGSYRKLEIENQRAASIGATMLIDEPSVTFCSIPCCRSCRGWRVHCIPLRAHVKPMALCWPLARCRLASAIRYCRRKVSKAELLVALQCANRTLGSSDVELDLFGPRLWPR